MRVHGARRGSGRLHQYPCGCPESSVRAAMLEWWRRMMLSHIEAGIPRSHHPGPYAFTAARSKIHWKFWEGTVAKHLGSLFSEQLEARAIADVVLMMIAVGARAVYQLFNALLAAVLMVRTVFAISALVLITLLTAFLMV